MSVLDSQTYPHILDDILRASDRPTICAIMRTSKSLYASALPVLYPNILSDPLLPLDMGYSTDGRGYILHISRERAKRRSGQLLASPHLGRVRQINIAYSEVYAGFLSQLQSADVHQRPHADPVPRPEGSILAISVRPFLPNADGLVRVYSGREDLVNTGMRIGGATGLPDAEGGESRKGSGGRRCGWDAIKKGWPQGYEFKHIFGIASLIPSTHLVLSIPPSSGVDLTAFLAACASYDKPQSVRKLTVLCSSRNYLLVQQFSMGRGTSWDSIDVVLVPDSSGMFAFQSNAPAPRLGHNQASNWAYKSNPSATLAIPLAAVLPTTVYTIVGLEGHVSGEEKLKALRRDVEKSGELMNGVISPRFAEYEAWLKAAPPGIRRLVG